MTARYARARVNRNPKAPDEWALFDVSHPIERARLRLERKGACWLGDDERDVDRRYRAARVWAELYQRAHGRTSGPVLSERVDGHGDSQIGAEMRAQASMDRMRIIHGRSERGEEPAHGMTPLRASYLDAVCGEGFTYSGYAERIGLSHQVVRRELVKALDAVAGYSPWANRIERVVVLAIRPLAKKGRKR